MLNMATMVSVDPMPMSVMQLQNTTQSQTELTGVREYGLILEKKL
jgi:hypothetical protein